MVSGNEVISPIGDILSSTPKDVLYRDVLFQLKCDREWEIIALSRSEISATREKIADDTESLIRSQDPILKELASVFSAAFAGIRGRRRSFYRKVSENSIVERMLDSFTPQDLAGEEQRTFLENLVKQSIIFLGRFADEKGELDVKICDSADFPGQVAVLLRGKDAHEFYVSTSLGRVYELGEINKDREVYLKNMSPLQRIIFATFLTQVVAEVGVEQEPTHWRRDKPSAP